MFGLGKRAKRSALLAFVLVVATMAILVGSGSIAGSDSSTAAGQWRLLPPAPIAIVAGRTSVWTGTELIVSGVTGAAPDGSLLKSVEVTLAYNPATNTWRKLAPSPLAAEQRPTGAWTGRELVLFVSGVDAANGKPSPARYARAAAYNPATDTWRRIAALPEPRNGATAVWANPEILIVGGMNGQGVRASVGLAYNPVANHWRRLAAVAGHTEGVSVWTGKRLLIWDGHTARPTGLAYDRLIRAQRQTTPLPACC
jgi:N-acetylneuraminic acid mutarotase